MQRLFLDLDNVITDYSYSAIEWFNEELSHPKYKGKYPTDLEPKDVKDYSIWKNYHLSKQIGKPLMEEMHNTPGFFAELDPIPGAINAVRKLNQIYEIFIATKPQINELCIVEKMEWLNVHMPYIHEERVIFLQNKSVLYGDILVDDYWKHLFQFEGRGILFMQPYNADRFDQFGYYVAGWVELEEQLNGIF